MEVTREIKIDINNSDIIEKDVLNDLDLILRKSYIDLFTMVVNKTPVDTGRARANWYSDINKFSGKENVNRFEPRGNKVIKNIIKKVEKESHSPLYDAYTLDNNIDYVGLLENGWSKQAPYGMVKSSLDAFEKILQEAIKEVVK